jgi:hypothetical protein
LDAFVVHQLQDSKIWSPRAIIELLIMYTRLCNCCRGEFQVWNGLQCCRYVFNLWLLLCVLTNVLPLEGVSGVTKLSEYLCLLDDGWRWRLASQQHHPCCICTCTKLRGGEGKLQKGNGSDKMSRTSWHTLKNPLANHHP